MLSIRAGNTVHGGQLAYAIGSDESGRGAFDASIAIRRIRGVQLIAASKPLQLGDMVNVIQERDFGRLSVLGP